MNEEQEKWLGMLEEFVRVAGTGSAYGEAASEITALCRLQASTIHDMEDEISGLESEVEELRCGYYD